MSLDISITSKGLLPSVSCALVALLLVDAEMSAQLDFAGLWSSAEDNTWNGF